MSKTRTILGGITLMGLTALPVVLIPASAASADTTTSTTSSTSDPLLIVCVTVTPKVVGVDINGDDIVLGPVGVPRTCVTV